MSFNDILKRQISKNKQPKPIDKMGEPAGRLVDRVGEKQVRIILDYMAGCSSLEEAYSKLSKEIDRRDGRIGFHITSFIRYGDFSEEDVRVEDYFDVDNFKDALDEANNFTDVLNAIRQYSDYVFIVSEEAVTMMVVTYQLTLKDEVFYMTVARNGY